MINKVDASLLLLEVLDWKKEYIKKQLKLYPKISQQELITKIKRAKYAKFRNRVNNIILNCL